MELILANASGEEIRVLEDCECDFDLGSTNDFELRFDRSDWKGDIEDGFLIYAPGTEYGGVVKRIGSVTLENVIKIGGYTWRGRLQKKVIEPPSGQAYLKVSGDLNTVIGNLIDSEFDGLIVANSESAGVSVSNYQFNRYCTLLDGLAAMCASKGYRLEIAYDSADACCYVGAVPAVDYSAVIELSDDSGLNFTTSTIKDGINHLICLGSGELEERLVVHLYVQQDGTIGDTQYYTGLDELADVYDFSQAEETELRQGGEDYLKNITNEDSFSAEVSHLDFNVAVGDIIGGRDYITGDYCKAPITGKIYKYESGEESISYTIGE